MAGKNGFVKQGFSLYKRFLSQMIMQYPEPTPAERLDPLADVYQLQLTTATAQCWMGQM